jgi:hypothetical protein
MPIADQAATDAENHRPMTRHQSGKGLLIALFGPSRQQGGVASRRPGKAM